MDPSKLSDDELLEREPLARIRAWDGKRNDHAKAANEWGALQMECQRRGLASSTTWTDFWPRSPRAKALRAAAGMREPDDLRNRTEST